MPSANICFSNSAASRIHWVMYGRRPRCKGKIGHFSEAFGCGHVRALRGARPAHDPFFATLRPNGLRQGSLGHLKVMSAIERCRTAALGCHVVR
jgi:hypothetical protein